MTPPSDTSRPSGLTKDEIRQDAQRACAIAHGRGAGMALLALFQLVLDEGIPSRAERERILAERLSEGDTTSLGGDLPDATA